MTKAQRVAAKTVDYGKYKARRCLSLHECAMCKKEITYGQIYHDGGYGKRAHVACVAWQAQCSCAIGLLPCPSHGWNIPAAVGKERK